MNGSTRQRIHSLVRHHAVAHHGLIAGPRHLAEDRPGDPDHAVASLVDPLCLPGCDRHPADDRFALVDQLRRGAVGRSRLVDDSGSRLDGVAVDGRCRRSGPQIGCGGLSGDLRCDLRCGVVGLWLWLWLWPGGGPVGGLRGGVLFLRLPGMAAAWAAAAVTGVVRFDDLDFFVAGFSEEVEDPGRCRAGNPARQAAVCLIRAWAAALPVRA